MTVYQEKVKFICVIAPLYWSVMPSEQKSFPPNFGLFTVVRWVVDS